MKRVGFILLLMGACSPTKGTWNLESHELRVIECNDIEFEAFSYFDANEGYRVNRLEAGQELLPPFNENTAHILRGNQEPLSFDFEIRDVQWPGGDAVMQCGTSDGNTFTCDYTETEWLRGPDLDGTPNQKTETFTAPGRCGALIEDYETQSCWQRGFVSAGSYKANTMTMEHTYYLTCLEGSSCLLTPISNRCTVTIITQYDYAESP